MKPLKKLIEAVYQGKNLEISGGNSSIAERAEAKKWLEKHEKPTLEGLSVKICNILDASDKKYDDLHAAAIHTYRYIRALENNDLERAKKYYKLCTTDRIFTKEEEDFMCQMAMDYCSSKA